MRGKIHILFMVSLILLTLFTVNLSTRHVNSMGEGFDCNITNDTIDQGKPSIYGNRLVWNEKLFENGAENWEIFLYDLTVDTDLDGEPNYIDADDDDDSTPDAQDPNPDLAKFRITNNASKQWYPMIHGDTIVWEDNRHGNFDIFMYDLTKDSDGDGVPNYQDDDRPTPDPAEIRITDNPAHQEDPAIYGTKIVWTDKRTGDIDVYIHDIISGKEAIIAGLNETGIYPDPINQPDLVYYPWQQDPSIYGDKVVWRESIWMDPKGSEIYMYNLSVDSDGDGVPNFLDDDRPIPDPAQKQITSNSEAELSPAIYGNFLVYIKPDNIFLYDIRYETEYKLTNTPPGRIIDAVFCDIYGTKIAWAYKEDSNDIYIFDLALDSDNDGTPNYQDDEFDPDTDPALIRITNESEKTSMLPRIHTNKIVWQGKRNASRPIDIYLYTITDNLPPEITCSMPNYTSQITEGEHLRFNISTDDPEGDDLTYKWFFDNIQLPDENTDYYEYISDYKSAGVHEVRVIVIDGEYPVEEMWLVYVAESYIYPKITRVEPVISPTIIEGGEVTLGIWAIGFEGEILDFGWTFEGEGISKLYPQTHHNTSDGEIHAWGSFNSKPDFNGSNYIIHVNITVEITNETSVLSYTWVLTMLYFEDIDMDGYNDNIENEWGSDPFDISSIPQVDTDHDFIVDTDDKDKDGDGFLDKHDEYILDPKKQVKENPDNSVEISVIIILLILLVVAMITLPGISRPR